MESIIFDWLHFLVRWLHIITAIAWIGASFYFVWLDNNLQTPPQWKKEQGVSGDLWAFHGGGIYEVGKYALAPPKMPKHLHWFKWEAYSTWITGTLLLALFYYYQADLYLVGQAQWSNTPSKAILLSIAYLATGFACYEFLLRSLARRSTPVFLISLITMVSLFCWFANISFSGRAAFLHVGALLATLMAANVFFGIMPAQRKFMTAIEAGRQPDANAMAFAKTRSIHNNYFTLPVLVAMISNHYPLLFGQAYSWWLLIVMMLTAAYARHFFNLRHKGVIRPHILLVSLGVFAALAFFTAMQKKRPTSVPTPIAKETDTPITQQSNNDDHARLVALTQQHCTACHSTNPSSPGFAAAPLGIVLDSIDDIRKSQARIATAVASGYMPLGNMSQMTDQQRQEYLLLVQKL